MISEETLLLCLVLALLALALLGYLAPLLAHFFRCRSGAVRAAPQEPDQASAGSRPGACAQAKAGRDQEKRQTAECLPSDLNAVLLSLSGELRSVFGPKVNLRLRPNWEACLAKIGSAEIKQAVRALAAKAAERIEDGCAVEVTTLCFMPDAVFAAANPDLPPGRLACIRLADTGCGLGENTARNLFKPDASRPGDGLAAAYQLVRSRGGSITAASCPGRGAVYTVYLPAA
jgi:signal transduction histidine kinase